MRESPKQRLDALHVQTHTHTHTRTHTHTHTHMHMHTHERSRTHTHIHTRTHTHIRTLTQTHTQICTHTHTHTHTHSHSHTHTHTHTLPGSQKQRLQSRLGPRKRYRGPILPDIALAPLFPEHTCMHACACERQTDRKERDREKLYTYFHGYTFHAVVPFCRI